MLFAFPSDYVVFWLTGSFSLDSAFGKPQSHQSVLWSKAINTSRSALELPDIASSWCWWEISTEWSFHCGYVLGDARKFLDQVTWKRWICFVKSSSPTCLVFPIFFEEWFDSRPPKRHAKTQAFPKQRCFYPRSLRRLKASWPLELLGFFGCEEQCCCSWELQIWTLKDFGVLKSEDRFDLGRFVGWPKIETYPYLWMDSS